MEVLTAVLLAVATLVLVALTLLRTNKSACRCRARMDGKTVIVTGANCGIGKETALGLAARGAKVILACRDLKRADEARDDIVAATGSKSVVIRQLDLESLVSVRTFVKGVLETENRLDVLVNNAGAGGIPLGRTEDGLERGMQVNHFGPFLLSCLLLDLLKRTPSSRIVVVSSMIHSYAGSFDVYNMNSDKEQLQFFDIYCWSKLCNILMTQYLAERLEGKGVTVNCLHPGFVRTEILRRIPSTFVRYVAQIILAMFFKSAKEGAQTSIHLAVSDEGGRVSGRYFVDLKEADVAKPAKVPGLATMVWHRSEDYVKLTENEKLRLFK